MSAPRVKAGAVSAFFPRIIAGHASMFADLAIQVLK